MKSNLLLYAEVVDILENDKWIFFYKENNNDNVEIR